MYCIVGIHFLVPLVNLNDVVISQFTYIYMLKNHLLQERCTFNLLLNIGNKECEREGKG